MDLRTFKDANLTRHDSLMPGFAKSNLNSRPVSRTNANTREMRIAKMEIRIDDAEL